MYCFAITAALQNLLTLEKKNHKPVCVARSVAGDRVNETLH